VCACVVDSCCQAHMRRQHSHIEHATTGGIHVAVSSNSGQSMRGACLMSLQAFPMHVCMLLSVNNLRTLSWLSSFWVALSVALSVAHMRSLETTISKLPSTSSHNVFPARSPLLYTHSLTNSHAQKAHAKSRICSKSSEKELILGCRSDSIMNVSISDIQPNTPKRIRRNYGNAQLQGPLAKHHRQDSSGRPRWHGNVYIASFLLWRRCLGRVDGRSRQLSNA
jgi:hypothetical protein